MKGAACGKQLFSVIPAKAGTHLGPLICGSGWVPAFAGMTDLSGYWPETSRSALTL